MQKLLLFILLSSIVFAQVDFEQYREKIVDFTGPDTVIVVGNHISEAEKIAFRVFREQYPHLEFIRESEATPENLGNRSVALIGGPAHNDFTAELLSANPEIQTQDVSVGKLLFVTKDGQKYLIYSDKSGFDNVRKYPEKSPLAKFIPLAYIPLAATAIGLSALGIGKLLFKLFHKILRRVVSAKIMARIKKKELNRKYKGFKLGGIRIKYREWFAVILGAFAFAAAVSYTYMKNNDGLFGFIMLSFAINIVIYALRDFLRLYMDKVHDLHTEYVFWYWGGLVTIITGWLGNALCLTGYTVSDRETKRASRIQYTINFWTFLVSLAFLIINFFIPSVVLQMAMVLSLGIAFVNMLPMYPFSGKNIYKWRKLRWFLTMIPMTLVYVFVNLT